MDIDLACYQNRNAINVIIEQNVHLALIEKRQLFLQHKIGVNLSRANFVRVAFVSWTHLTDNSHVLDYS